MVLNVEGWREVCCGVVRRGGDVRCGVVFGGMEGGLLWYCVWRDGGRSVVVLYVEGGGRYVVVLYVEGEGGLLWYCAWRNGGKSVVVLYVERWREVCCGIVCGGMEGGLLWCCTWRGRDVRCGDVFGGGR